MIWIQRGFGSFNFEEAEMMAALQFPELTVQGLRGFEALGFLWKGLGFEVVDQRDQMQKGGGFVLLGCMVDPGG